MTYQAQPQHPPWGSRSPECQSHYRCPSQAFWWISVGPVVCLLACPYRDPVLTPRTYTVFLYSLSISLSYPFVSPPAHVSAVRSDRLWAFSQSSSRLFTAVAVLFGLDSLSFVLITFSSHVFNLALSVFLTINFGSMTYRSPTVRWCRLSAAAVVHSGCHSHHYHHFLWLCGFDSPSMCWLSAASRTSTATIHPGHLSSSISHHHSSPTLSSSCSDSLSSWLYGFDSLVTQAFRRLPHLCHSLQLLSIKALTLDSLLNIQILNF